MIIPNPEAPESLELRKWEMRPTTLVPNPLKWGEGGRMGMPFQPFPKAMYLMVENPKGGFLVAEFLTVENEQQEANLRSRGFGEGQGEAYELLLERQQALACAAAERADADRKLSAAAQAEAQRADDATGKHLGEIPATPIKPRGR